MKQNRQAGGSRRSSARFVPSVQFVCFRGGARRVEPPLSADIIVIDDFWHDPLRLRQEALRGPFEHRISPSGFSFSAWKASERHAQRVAELIARVCGPSVLARRLESRFVFETADDETTTRKRVWVHHDCWSRVALLHLSEGERPRAGTAFHEHVSTGISAMHPDVTRSQRDALSRDSTSSGSWREVMCIDHRFNRMVIFNPLIFHQAVGYFGSKAEDSRLYNIVVIA